MRVVAALGAAFLLAACGGGEHEARPVVVPDVVGLPQEQAYCTLAAAGLRWRTGGERIVHSRARGQGAGTATRDACRRPGLTGEAPISVLEQSPAARTRVHRGTVVHLEDSCTLLRALGTACL